jgi:hypothetical protein
MMAAQLRDSRESEGTGISQALKEGLNNNNSSSSLGNGAEKEVKKEKLVLKNRAGKSRSPYVKGHENNPVKWQIWGEEAVELARRENRLLFLSIGYSACHCK